MDEFKSEILEQMGTEKSLRVQIDGLNQEIRRKSYIASGLLALIFETKDADLIGKAKKIVTGADKESR